MSPKEAAALWGKVCTALRRKGIVALWVREPTRKNKIHYHLLVSSRQSKAELETTIIAAMPSRKETPWHKNIKPVDDRWWLAYYITKAKKSGMFRGKVVPDKYMTKRLLFKPNTKLHKHGEIGKFWLKPTKALWKSIQEREAKIEKGLADGRVGRLARYAFELINGEVPLKTIERNFGYFADTAGIQDWLAVISDGEAVPA
jgi:hypothetical protein